MQVRRDHTGQNFRETFRLPTHNVRPEQLLAALQASAWTFSVLQVASTPAWSVTIDLGSGDLTEALAVSASFTRWLEDTAQRLATDSEAADLTAADLTAVEGGGPPRGRSIR